MSNDEISKEIRDTFHLSWLYVEMKYAELIIIHNRSEYTPLYRAIYMLINTRYDQKLQAGMSLDSLILSRSKVYGLRPEQASLQIMIDSDSPGFIIRYREGAFTSESRIDIQSDGDIWLPNEIQALVDRLVDQPID